MDTKVSKLIEKLDKTISDDRDKLLLSLGLTEKEYSPNGEKSHKYNLCDYIDGKQRYYREVPMTITDEEYELILSKLKLVNEIKSKEESEQRKKQEQSSKSLKKWTPVFSKPNEDTYEEKPAKDTDSSKLAIVMRIIAYLGGIFGIFGGLLTGDGFYIAISIISCIVCFVLFNALAEILDRFAELNAILRNGFVYKEEKNKK